MMKRSIIRCVCGCNLSSSMNSLNEDQLLSALKIRARDERSGAEAEVTIDFEMVADRKLAAKVPR